MTLRKTKYYLCSAYHSGGNERCGHCHVDRDALLKAVAEKLRERVLMGSPEKLERAIQKQLDRRCAAPAVDKSAVRRKLAKLDSQIERHARRILAVDDSAVADVNKQLVALKRDRDSLAAILEETAPKRLPSAKQIAAKIWELDQVLREGPSTQVRLALRQTVSSIVLNFKPDGQTRRGKRYRFTGGVMRLASVLVKQPAVCGG